MNPIPVKQGPAWRRLAAHAGTWRDTHLAALFSSDPARATRFIATAPGLQLEYSRQRVGAPTLQMLVELAQERDIVRWRNALFAGEPVNSTEQRAARHTA